MKLVKPKGKHRNEKNLDNNEKTDKNTSGWPNGSRLCRSATHSAALRAGSARDSQLKATNCRRDGSYTPAIPFHELLRQFRALLCLKNLLAEGKAVS